MSKASRFHSLISPFRFLGLGVLAIAWTLSAHSNAQAQDCNNPAATPHVCAFDPVKHAQAGTKLKGVLLYDWRYGGQDRGPTQRAMMRLAQKYGFRLDRSDSNTYINDSTLEGIDLVVVNNSDQDPFTDPEGLRAMRNFVEVRGKSVLALHTAAAYIPCPGEDLNNAGCRWMMRALRTQFWMKNPDPTSATIFADSVRAGEIPPRATGISAVPSARNHGRMHPETRMIFENLPTNAGAGPLANQPYIWEGLGSQWFNYRNNPRLEGERIIEGVKYGPINILLSLDESSVADNAGCNGGANGCKNQGTFGDRPVSWTRKVGNGLFAYINGAHSDIYVRTRNVGGVTVRDSIFEKLNWRIMKYLARDFVGCMEPNSWRFNPQASVERLTERDTENPCSIAEPILSRFQTSQGNSPRYSVFGQTLRLHAQGQRQYQALLFDAAGVLRWRGVIGNSEGEAISGLQSGNYFLMTMGRNALEVSKTYRVTIP